ncbi:30S ribosome-binding factor RbfA [Microbispora sp. NPDC049125]|uniref:30S ribosome-binding factor RbfA n=1 Tax=Microbispora sp. NPDC049125 TaxID=3154929 RepID=UPI0034658771
MDAARARKLADRIQQVVAEMLERRIKDPRLGFVTVTDAKITADLGDATVYYTVFGSEAERADTAAALESAKGIIRSEVGRQTGLRHTPTLAFVHDPLPDSARHMDDLFAVARAKDEEIAKKAQGATFAGDADPYRFEDDLEGDLELETTGEAGEDETSDRAGRRAR